MIDAGDSLGPAQATFVLLSFEGPDRYSMAGGLGTRVTELSGALAAAGYETHLVFVGDPHAPATEARGALSLHRWAQWLSQHHPGGVYAGEEVKRGDFEESVPAFVIEQIARPAIEAGRLLVVMAEDWHTTETLCRLSDQMHSAGLRSRCVLLWNANNTTGFHRIDWQRLDFVSTLTTVSRYMKHLMWRRGVNPFVIPNGIPAWLLKAPDGAAVARLRQSLGRGVRLCKIARWDPDKRWLMAIDALGALRGQGLECTLVAHGGSEAHGAEVLDRAHALGLRVREVSVDEPTLEHYTTAFAQAAPAELLNVRSFIPLPVLAPLYRACDAVLANSGHEPFGLVGLEAMASGGIAITGGTGEDYAVHSKNGLTLDTSDPAELAWYVRILRERPQFARRLRATAQASARHFAWERVVELLLLKLEFLAVRQLALPDRRKPLQPVRSTR